MFSKVVTENILSEHLKFKKIKQKITPFPWMNTPPVAVLPYVVPPLLRGEGESST